MVSAAAKEVTTYNSVFVSLDPDFPGRESGILHYV